MCVLLRPQLQNRCRRSNGLWDAELGSDEKKVDPETGKKWGICGTSGSSEYLLKIETLEKFRVISFKICDAPPLGGRAAASAGVPSRGGGVLCKWGIGGHPLPLTMGKKFRTQKHSTTQHRTT